MTSDILFGAMVLCTATLTVLLVTGEVEKNPGPGVEAEKIFVACAAEISNREHTVTRVDAGSISAVVMLQLKWRI